MDFGVLGDLNWLAVIVAAIAYFALGALWFANAVFGKAWQRAGGLQVPEGQRPGPAYIIGPAITCLIATVALAMLAEATATITFGEGIVLGLVTGVGMAAPIVAVTGLFDPRKPNPQTWLFISAGYHVVGFLVASVILAVWH